MMVLKEYARNNRLSLTKQKWNEIKNFQIKIVAVYPLRVA